MSFLDNNPMFLDTILEYDRGLNKLLSKVIHTPINIKKNADR